MQQRPLNLALVGMPGSGKSTVGRQLARQLGWRFVDADHEIEQRIGGPIRAFFEQHGEPAFRDLEQQVIADLCAPERAPQVLATGGGAVLRPANRAALHQGCVVVYLKSSPEDLFRRLRHDTQRPLLQVGDPLKRLRELFRERDPLYLETMHYQIETGRPTVPTLVNMILMQLEVAGLVDAHRGAAPAAALAAPPQAPGAVQAKT